MNMTKFIDKCGTIYIHDRIRQTRKFHTRKISAQLEKRLCQYNLECSLNIKIVYKTLRKTVGIINLKTLVTKNCNMCLLQIVVVYHQHLL